MSIRNKFTVPPNSKESEMMVLGCMLTSLNSLNISSDELNEQDFYYTEHKIIFNSLKAAFRNDKPADIHIIAEDLKSQNKLQAVGGVAYLTTLAQYAGTSAYIEEYVEIVKNKALLRKIIQATQEIEKQALHENPDAQACLNEAQTSFFKIGQHTAKRDGVLVRDILSGMQSKTQIPFLKELADRRERYLQRGDDEPAITGLRTHYPELDSMINGLGNSHLIILAARPAMGKTALAINIAEHVCFKSNLAVGIFSLEMTAEQLMHRLVCSQSEVESDKIKMGTLNPEEFHRVAEAVRNMQDYEMIIDDQPGLKITDLRSRARRMKERYDIKLLIIDYLQLISGSSSTRNLDNRVNEISEISRMLKNLARELDIPVICLSQLSRKVEERAGHRPQMSDLRESGSIEQDADIIMLLFRQEYYISGDKPGQAELIIAKNRHGEIGSVQFCFKKKISKFLDIEHLESYISSVKENACTKR